MRTYINAAIDFQPLNDHDYRSNYKLWIRFIDKLSPHKIGFKLSYRGYTKYHRKFAHNSDYKMYPCVFPCWDNASRRVNQPFVVYHKSTPELFESYFRYVYQTFDPFSDEENLIFINAWNEWAEGCHLEPDIKYGRGFLEAIKTVVESE